MTNDALYTLDELAQASEVTPRTIRFYTSEGLLPPPQARGRFALYGVAHCNRLRLIVLLKQALMPLAAIRVHLPHVTDAQVAALVSQKDTDADELERTESGEAFHLESSAVGLPVGKQAEAYRVLAGALSARPGAVNSAPPQSPPAVTDRRQRRALFVSARLNPDALPNAEQSGEDDTSRETNTIQNPKSWQRILLAPGVELHVRIPETPDARQHLDQVIAETKSLFKP